MKAVEKRKQKSSLLDKWLNRQKEGTSPGKITPRPNDVPVPLSRGQERLLFVQQLYPDNPFYNYADTYRVTGDLNVGALLKSFEIIGRRHEILRTTFGISAGTGEASQEIHKDFAFEVIKRDLRTVPESRRVETAKKMAVKLARQPFDLSRGPLTRIAVLQLADNDHFIILTMHHIVFDKWSMGILLQELADNYRNLVSGKQVSVIRPDVQYGDFSYWQKDRNVDPETIAYWTDKLQSASPLLDLPFDYPEPDRPSFRGAHSKHQLSNSLTLSIREACIETKTTPYVFLLAVYKVLLSRYTLQTDISVGSPFTNRDRTELESAIGFFDDTLVLRSDLSGSPSFSEVLERVKETCKGAFSHRQMPFETLVGILKPNRYLNHNPLFQVMFIYHDAARMPSFGPGLMVENEPLDIGVAKFDLTLFISDEGQRMSAIFEYAEDLFAGTTIDRMHEHLTNLLEAILEKPGRRIGELTMAGDGELEQMMTWNDTPEPEFGDAAGIHQLFEKQARLHPDSPAVSFNEEELTYAELNTKASTLAARLQELNLDRNKPLGLFAEPSVDMVVGILGILKAGLAYLPLDAGYPQDRINLLLEDSSASLILAQRHLSGRIVKNPGLAVLPIEELCDEASPEPGAGSVRSIDESDAAYLIYTSGSTGRPKGVSISHRNLLNSTAARFRYYGTNPGSFLLLSSFSFDSSVAGIFWTLTTGGRLVVTERRVEQDMEHLSRLFAENRITHTLILPSVYRLLLESTTTGDLNSLQTVIVAGEECSASISRAHFEKLPDVKLFNEYGPTEATVWATVYEIKRENITRKVPIGKPIPGAQIYILDDEQNQVPIGAAGEICIGGKGVADGYLNDSELTSRRFITDTHSRRRGLKLYRTGDLGRYRSDGAIIFLGRKDDQVKIRGYRIEPREIADVIAQIPGVKEVLVKPASRPILPAGDEFDPEFLRTTLEKMNPEQASSILDSVERMTATEAKFTLDKEWQ